jgi:hypothetical protein
VPPRLLWAGAGLVVLIVGIVLAVVLLGGGGGAPQSEGRSPKPGESAGGPSNIAFVFRPPKVETVRVTGKVRVPDLRGGSAAITTSLSRLYDQTVIDRTHWVTGPPPSVWNAFAPDVRAKARTDAGAFTLGRSAALMKTLQVSSSSLTIRYLIDDHGRVVAAQASSYLKAVGELKDGRPVRIIATGELLLKQVSGTWLISGYPSASVTVASPEAVSPPATSGAAPSASSS